jgi:hypothetical protein
VGLLHLLVVGGRRDASGLDVRLQLLRRHVLDVALAVVERLDDARLDVHEEDALAGLGEGVGERDPDVAGADDCDVPGHGRVAYRAAAILSLAYPSP